MKWSAAVIGVAAALAAGAHAERIYWIRADITLGAWHDPGNWSTGTVPGAADTAVFNISATVGFDQDIQVGALEFGGERNGWGTLRLFGHDLQVNGPISITDEYGVYARDAQGSVIRCTDLLLANGSWTIYSVFPDITVSCDSLTVDDGSTPTDRLTLFRAWILDCPTVTVGERGVLALHNSMVGTVVCAGEFWPDSRTGECNPSIATLDGDLILLPGTQTRMANHTDCPRVLHVDGHAVLGGRLRLDSEGPDATSCDVFADLIVATNGIEGAFSEIRTLWPYTEWSNCTATYRDDAVEIQYYPLADVDRDGTVGIGDVLVVLLNWGCEGGPWSCPGDIAGEPQRQQSVNIRDFLAVLAHWGESLCEDGGR
jgi:hypothetical protein